MTRNLEPIGDARLNRALRNAQLDTHNAETLARITRETSIEQPQVIRGATAGGDERKLRGIPCIARGVPGHVPGTRP